jgi:hypothetical protein
MAGEPDDSDPVSTHEFTRLLKTWRAGDDGALEQLMPIVYGELHRRLSSTSKRPLTSGPD